MDNSIFEKGKELEYRIYQLELLKKYMEHLLSAQPFSIKIETSVLGHKSFQPFTNINGKHETNLHYLHDTDDGKFIIESLQSRIDYLKKEFDSL